LANAKYYIRTAHGISKLTNGHKCPEPFYGSGQGAADSMPRWGLLSDLIIKLYNKRSRSTKTSSPISGHELITKIRAYVDDTNCIMTCNDIEELIDMLQHNAATWEQLLYTIGGKLELSKCKFTVYNWKQDNKGTMILSTDKSIGKIRIMESESGKEVEINEIAPTETYKLLAIPMAVIGAERDQREMIKTKCQQMIKMIKTANLPTAGNWTAYRTIAIPKITYGMAALEIPAEKLWEIQKQFTHAYLPYLGYNRNTPLSVVYATIGKGGIGLTDLPTLEGVAHILYIIGSIRCSDDTKKPITALIESYQILSGMIESPFSNTEPRKYIKAPWMDVTRTFMHKIDAKIKILNVNMIEKRYTNDKEIMSYAIKYTDEIKKQTIINNCRLYLQIFLISDMTNKDGDRLNADIHKGKKNIGTNNNRYQSIIWPVQLKPPKTAWRIWRKMLRTMTKKNSYTLKRPLYGKKSTSNKTAEKHQCNMRDNKRSWKTRTKMVERIVDAKKLEIIITSNRTNNDFKSSFEIHSEKEFITYNELNTPKHQELCKQQTEINIVRLALETVHGAYNTKNVCNQNNNIQIWVDNAKIKTLVDECKYNLPTITSSTKNNAECTNSINRILNKYNGIKIKLTSNSAPEKIKESIERQNKITRQYTNSTKMNATDLAILRIEGELININLRKELTTASTDRKYIPYLAEKINVSIDTLKTIDWKALEEAIKKRPFTSTKTVNQFIHHWLPTRGHPSMAEHFENQVYCPRCKQHTETNEHFLWCQKDREEWIQEYENEIMKKNNTKIHKELVKVTIAVLKKQKPTLTDQYRHIRNEQQRIGWEQIPYGRYRKLWAEEYELETELDEGRDWMKTNITILWKHIKKRWTSRCELVHDDSPEAQLELQTVMDKRIENRYDQINNLPYTERQIFHKDIDVMKQLPTKTKRDWLQRTKRIINSGKARMRTRNKNTVCNIQTFFGVVVATNTTVASTQTSHKSTKHNRRTNSSRNMSSDQTEKDLENLETHRKMTKIPNVTLRSEYDPP
jgi:hypothetical protein